MHPLCQGSGRFLKLKGFPYNPDCWWLVRDPRQEVVKPLTTESIPASGALCAPEGSIVTRTLSLLKKALGSRRLDSFQC